MRSVTLGILGFLTLLTLSAQAVEIHHGEWKQGSVLRGSATPGTRLELDGQPVRVSDDGRFVIGLGRDAGSPAILKEFPPEGDPKTLEFEVVLRDYQIQRIEGVPQRTVTPDPEQLARAREEAALARAAREKDLPRTDFAQQFQWPLVGIVTGVYGSQRIYNGEPRSPHYGVDIASPTGTPVLAPASGVVTLVHENMFFSGGTLIVDHGHGLSSTFIHLSKILVKEGDEVKKAQPIAEVGATGRATGPHLDWRMNWFDRRVDPTSLVGPMPKPAPEPPAAPQPPAVDPNAEDNEGESAPAATDEPDEEVDEGEEPSSPADAP